MTIASSRSVSSFSRAAAAIINAGRAAAARGWVPATSGDFSARIDENSFAVTRSSVDRGSLPPDDVIVQAIDAPLEEGSSAETARRKRLYRDPSEDVEALAERVAVRLAEQPNGAIPAPGHVLAGHGLAAPGSRRQRRLAHLEALETLFQQVLLSRSYRP